MCFRIDWDLGRLGGECASAGHRDGPGGRRSPRTRFLSSATANTAEIRHTRGDNMVQRRREQPARSVPANFGESKLSKFYFMQEW
eukprot:scaffold12959_cov116-Isochrysis_galbana.AAC.14